MIRNFSFSKKVLPSLIFGLLLITSHTFSQPSVRWEKRYGGVYNDWLSASIPTPDGGSLQGGTKALAPPPTYSGGVDVPLESTDFWIVKLDADGNKIWEKTFGREISDRLISIVATPDGGFLLGGNSRDYKPRTYSPNYIWVVKIDANGNRLWDNIFRDDVGNAYLKSVVITRDGNALLGAYSFGKSGFEKTAPHYGDRDIWVIKIDPIGRKLWDQSYGGSFADDLNSIVLGSDGGYLLCGDSSSGKSGTKTSASIGDGDFWLVKIDENGQQLWEKVYGGTGLDVITAQTVTPEGGYLLVGDSYSPISGDKTEANPIGANSAVWMIKIDRVGNKTWDRTYVGLPSTSPSEYRYDQLTKVIPINGGFLLGGGSQTGSTEFHGWLLKIKDLGGKNWESFSATHRIVDIIQINPSRYLVAGHMYDLSVLSDRYRDIWVKSLSDLEISAQALPQNVCQGATANFTFSVQGSGLLYYWQIKKAGQSAWENVLSGTGPTLEIPANSLLYGNGNRFRCYAYSAPNGSLDRDYTYSNEVALTISSVVPTIISQPTQFQYTVLEGSSISFSMTAKGDNLWYHWVKDNQIINGSFTPRFSIANASLNDAGTYRGVAGNACGWVNTRSFSLKVNPNSSGPYRMASPEGGALSVKVLGNPIIGEELGVEVKSGERSPIHVSLSDNNGILLHDQHLPADGETQLVKIPVKGQVSGTYLLRVATSTEQRTLHILKR